MSSSSKSRKVMAYDELEVGQELATMELVIEEDTQGRYLVAVQDDNPWYHSESPWGAPITHLSALDGSPMWAVVESGLAYPFGWVHAKQETEFIHPLPLGKPVRVTSRIADKYQKRERGYVVIESMITDKNGVEIMRVRNHGMIDDQRVREAAKSGLKSAPPLTPHLLRA